MEAHLGIDIGTSSVKVTAVRAGSTDGHTMPVIGSWQQSYNRHKLSVVAASDDTFVEQDPHTILDTLGMCLRGALLDIEPQYTLRRIAVCGQMHGVILWTQDTCIVESVDFSSCKIGGKLSTLITWEDRRCSQSFLQSLPVSCGLLASGYGCASLFWLNSRDKQYLDEFTCAGTIGDFIVSVLCGQPSVVMSDHNAASWGYYDILNKCWQLQVLTEADFPVHLLPPTSTAGTIAGKTSGSIFGLPADVPVYVAVGDAQCSVASSHFQSHQAVLNMGTSAQLSFASVSNSQPSQHLQLWPYRGDNYLSVLASMNGGNVLADFINMLKQWLTGLGDEITTDALWEKVKVTTTNFLYLPMSIVPKLYKERATSGVHERVPVTNISTKNTSLANIYQQICVGLARNIQQLLPTDSLQSSGVTEILCTGSMFNRHPYMLSAVQHVFDELSVTLTSSDANAALGAIFFTQ